MFKHQGICCLGIIDDHPILVEGVRSLFRNDKRFQWAGSAQCMESVRSLAARGKLDLLIFDLKLRKADGLEVVRRLQPDYPRLKYLALSASRNSELILGLVAAGIGGYVAKDDDPHELVAAVWEIFCGKRYISKSIRPDMLQHQVEGRGKSAALSTRESQIFRLIGEGMKNREIAEALGLSIKTVEAHKENLKRKLGLSSSNELAKQAILGQLAG